MDAKDTILIVEDDPTMCLLIKRMLEQDAYEILVAVDGVEAQAIMKSSKREISAILLDWQMPRMNGIEFLRWIKKEADYEHIPVVMETSMVAPEDIKEGIDAGAFYYLTKPMEEKVLRAIVRAALWDLHEKKSLLEKIRRGNNPFKHLVEGRFRFKTTEEAEFLAIAIANASAVPQK
ncbi:MAG TPA: response regulator, partial [Bacteroidota bacterium]